MSVPRLSLLIAVTMVAFAANSLLNRFAVDGGFIGAFEFAGIRVLAGAAMLGTLLALQGAGFGEFNRRRLGQAITLALYLLGFSLAYIALDAGLGALILFGGVQVTMFLVGLWQGEQVPAQRWLGAGLAMAGLALLVWPSGPDFSASGMLAMIAAAIGWGLFSILGRGAATPLQDTGISFLIAVPLVCIPAALFVLSSGPAISPMGVLLAVVSGAVTSGLGYALWYAVLRHITASLAALVQLSAPLLAVLGGAILLGEVIGWRMILAAAMILGGIALGLVQRRIGSSGS